MVTDIKSLLRRLRRHPWETFWMQFAGYHWVGRLATRLAQLASPPYKGRRYLARLNFRGYVSPNTSISHDQLLLGHNVFIGDRVTIYKAPEGGAVRVGDRTHIHQDGIVETGQGGSLTIGSDTHIQPRCQLSAYKGTIEIGSGVQIAPGCAFYSYDHGTVSGESMTDQPLLSKGGIVIEDEVWLGFGVVVLDGVRIGRGAVIGAGAVVTRSIPAEGIAAGVPAKLIGMRSKPTEAVADNV